MRIRCASCHKVFNFRSEKLPDRAFSFSCNECNEKIFVTEDEISDARIKTREKSKIEMAGEKWRKSIPKIDPVKLKKPLMKLVGLVSRISDRSEREWLFSLTKFAAIFSIVALFVLITLGAFTLFSAVSNTKVSYAEVEQFLYLKKDPTLSIDSAIPGIKISDRVKKYLGNEHREIFVEWLNGLEDHQKADFIDNLDLIIQQAQNQDPDNIYDYINEYKNLKYNRSVKKPFVQYLLKVAIVIALITMIVLVGLFCLVLLQLTWQKTVFEP